MDINPANNPPADDPAAGDLLAGDLAVVTGVCGRLGAVWTDALLGAGARVLGVDLHAAPTPRLAEVLARYDGDRFALVKADITDRLSLEAARDECLARFGAPTILVNNAGVDQPPSVEAGSWTFDEIPEALSGTVLDVNLHGTLRVCQVFGSELASRGRGSVVNIGSLYGGVAPDPRLYAHLPLDPPFLKPPAYGMSKAGVAALTRYLAALWGPLGVRVNTLSPGGVLGGQDPRFQQLFTARVPLRRMAHAEDLGGPLLFLASRQSGYVTGVELLVDGGYACW